MKKALRILTVCTLLFALCLSFVGCNQQLSGTYEATFGDDVHTERTVTLEFVLYWARVIIVDHTGEVPETIEHVGTYQLADGTITFRFEDLDGAEMTYSFSRETVDGVSAIRINDDLFIATELKLE